MASQAIFPFVLVADCSESVFCERLWEMTVLCCKWSCIMCRAVATSSSETCSDVGGAVAEESSHPFQALLHPCFHRVVPCHWAWLQEMLLLMGRQGDSEVSRKRRHAYIGADSVAGIITLQRCVPSFFSRLLSVPRFPLLLGSLPACAPFICTRFTVVHVDKEMRRQICFLYLHLGVVELEASTPSNSPVLFAVLCQNEAAAVFRFLHLTPHWNQVRRRLRTSCPSPPAAQPSTVERSIVRAIEPSRLDGVRRLLRTSVQPQCCGRQRR